MPRPSLRGLLPGAGVILVSLLCLWEAAHYDLGSLRVFGPGAFPVGLAVILFVLGVILIAPTVGRLVARRPVGDVDEYSEAHAPVPAVVSILASLVAFSLLIERFGLLPAVIAVVLISSLADRSLSWKVLLALAAGLAIACVLVFSVMLGLPIDALDW